MTGGVGTAARRERAQARAWQCGARGRRRVAAARARRRSQRARSAQRGDDAAIGESAAGESATDESVAAEGLGGAAAAGLRRVRALGGDGFFKGLAPCREETCRAKARRASGRPKRALRDAPRREAAWWIWM
ncbi:hypothetical protein [Lysobacter enzymogenes]|uniref:hypothetical protein n=1 Tax=Lysobacter enzymogenes TaxID=69 RepID=UPI00111387E8|nr:hypothetical protein [Lysobacter enzymogenes]